MRLTFLTVLASVFLAGCFGSKAKESIKNTDIPMIEDNTTYVSTYLIKVKKTDDNEKEVFELHKVIKAEGYLKNQMSSSIPKDGKLLFEFLDAEKNVFYRTILDNPLSKHFEVPNQNGEIESKSVKINEETIGIRMNFVAEISKIRISKIINQEMEYLTTLEVQSED